MSAGVEQTFWIGLRPITLGFVDDNTFGVPAGWYPDPLGLPQLRWWDSQAWTEHTSEARAPIVVQPASTTRTDYIEEDLQPSRVSYADETSYAEEAETRRSYYDEGLPSRREQRERERREEPKPFYEPVYADDELPLQTQIDPVQEELSAQPLLAMTLKELEPPLTDTVDDATPGPKRASAHANAAPAASTLSALAEEEAPERSAKQMKTYTGAVWAIALMPAIQLVANVLLITVFGLGNNQPLLLTVIIAPYFLVLFFAAFDRLVLQTWGHKHPASQWWALLSEPGYLVARVFRTYRETGKGFAPLGIFGASVVAVLGGMLVLPGLLIGVLPATFAAEVESSVEADAFALGADIDVTCPAPPLLVGETFTCIRTSEDGSTDSVAVQLERRNGWIAWQVVDWGPSVMFR